MTFVFALLRGYGFNHCWNVGEYHSKTEAEDIVKRLNEIVKQNEIRVDDLADKIFEQDTDDTDDESDNSDKPWCYTPLGYNTKLFIDIKDELMSVAPLARVPDNVDLSVVDMSLGYEVSDIKMIED